MIRTYKLLVENYEAMAFEIRNFTPPGKSAEYVESFKKSMNQIVLPILAKATEFKKNATSVILQNNILSSDNNYFMTDQSFQIKVEYQYQGGGTIMDRGGKK